MPKHAYLVDINSMKYEYIKLTIHRSVRHASEYET